MDDMTHIQIAEHEQASQLDEELMAALEGPDVDPIQFPWTDAGNALLFVAMFGENVRYVEPWKNWLVWDGARWVITSDTKMLPLARKATEYMFTWATTLPEDRRAALRRHALATQKEQRLRAMINIAKGESAIGIAPDRLDANPMLLGCSNGTLDLQTGMLRPPMREDFITKSTGVAYNPKSKCPNWLATLCWAMQDDAGSVEHLQRFAGYLLTGSVIEEKLFAFFGSGANGKTTVAMMLLDLLGDYASKGRKDFSSRKAKKELHHQT